MERALTPGVLVTATPCRAALARSTWSVPVPQTETSRKRGQAAKTRAVKREEERMLSTTSGRADALDQDVFGAGQRVVIVELGARLQGREDGAGGEYRR